jgi:hypothetical protein
MINATVIKAAYTSDVIIDKTKKSMVAMDI